MRIFRKCIGIVLLLQICGFAVAQVDYPFRDTNLSHDERIKDLLSRLNITEKISLLRNTSPAISRLGIDKYYHGNEALHGVVRPGKFTVFPQAIGMASMWNPELLQDISTAISDEARGKWNELNQGKDQTAGASDLLTFWSPTVNMARDPRWGRTPETYGEDPFLTGVLGTAFVRGLQGNNPEYIKVVSTPKHFAANNEEHNRASGNAVISERDLREYYFPAFEKCIKEGKAQSIMSAYNAVNGVPCSLNKWLLTDVLRKDWGFDGYVVSDCSAPEYVVTQHHYVSTYEESASLCMKAGLDLECGDNVYVSPLLNAYNRGMVTLGDIDSAAYRVLRGRMRLGLFDDPQKNPYNKISPTVVGCEKHKELALEAARQSLVLLKNDKNALPIDLEKIQSIAIVGINAAKCEFGDYSGTPVNAPVSVLEGIKARVGDQVEVKYAPWASPSLEYALIGRSAFPEGLKVEYFANATLSGTPNVRTEDYILFDPANRPPDPLVPGSPVSIRWTGKLVAPATGQYTFAFTSDDGCRLYLDGKKLIDSWRVRSEETDYISVSLEKGKTYELIAEYFDNGGQAIAKLAWKTPAVKAFEYTLMGKSAFPNGLEVEYFANADLSGTPKSTDTKESLLFDPKKQPSNPMIPKSPMSIRWTGDLIAPATGRHTFAFTSDDGCRLYLDGKLLVDSWRIRSEETDYVSVYLEQGKTYKLVAEYFDNGGEAIAKLAWRTPESISGDLLEAYGDAGKVIRESDLTVAVLGIDRTIEREGQDRSTIELPEDQQIFIEEAYKANPNIVVVLVAGSSLAINWIDQNIPAVLDAWYPGEQGGTAVAEALFGDYNPGGRLPLTFYNSLSELPAFDDYNVRNNRTYMYFEGKPLYAFGYGLSYTSFDYRGLDITQNEEDLIVKFKVSNSGIYDGDEVAQIYVQFPDQGRTIPLKQLKGFKRVHIAKGQEAEITIQVPKKELRLWDENMSAFYVPEGDYIFQVGASSDDIRMQKVVSIRDVSSVISEYLDGVRVSSQYHSIVVVADNSVHVDIYNVDGRHIRSAQNISAEYRVEVLPGNYIVKIINEDKKSAAFKVIVL
ncbi:glycoside hydrolase family 3 C-terminal domain-containing protein [Coprobacter sp.]